MLTIVRPTCGSEVRAESWDGGTDNCSQGPEPPYQVNTNWLAKTDYLERHNKAAVYIHWKVCQHYSIEIPERWYEHKPETVTENEEVTILWDMKIHTDRELSANKPDIVIKDHANRCCKPIDVSVPSDRTPRRKSVKSSQNTKILRLKPRECGGMRTETVHAGYCWRAGTC